MKLGTRATYLGAGEGDRRPVVMNGVVFRPGQTVNLADTLDEDKAKAMAQKLAGNTFFSVEGGPDYSELAEERAAEERAAFERTNAAVLDDGDDDEDDLPPGLNLPTEPTLETKRAAPTRSRKKAN